MPASVSIGPAMWMDGATYNGSVLRPITCGLLVSTVNQVMSGVLPGGGGLGVNAGSGMSVAVGTGYLVIASSAGVTAGGYLGAVNTVTTLTLAGSDPVNPRIDLVCATVSDVGNASSAWLLQVITGIPAGSPVAPSLPPDSLALATVLVPANSLSVSGGNITDERVFTAAQGGIVPVPNLTSGVTPLTGYQGMHIYDRSTLRTARLTNTGAVAQLVTLPFTPQRARKTTNVPITPSVGGVATLCSVSVITDGNTDLEIQVKWPGLFIGNSAAFGVYGAMMRIRIDSGVLDELSAPASTNAQGTTGNGAPGGGWTYVTSAGVDRPAAGTHTITFDAVGFGDGTNPVEVVCTPGAAVLYVRAAPL